MPAEAQISVTDGSAELMNIPAGARPPRSARACALNRSLRLGCGSRRIGMSRSPGSRSRRRRCPRRRPTWAG
ncbi:hypothetical protein ACFFX0_15405 [Citricoccus parietis]|uniref:Uncharacterized protein n=1 Tax=Citricoccus parietis TaxID=592307 RepID=A0ABV5G0Q0_9MICC